MSGVLMSCTVQNWHTTRSRASRAEQQTFCRPRLPPSSSGPAGDGDLPCVSCLPFWDRSLQLLRMQRTIMKSRHYKCKRPHATPPNPPIHQQFRRTQKWNEQGILEKTMVGGGRGAGAEPQARTPAMTFCCSLSAIPFEGGALCGFSARGLCCSEQAEAMHPKPPNVGNPQR